MPIVLGTDLLPRYKVPQTSPLILLTAVGIGVDKLKEALHLLPLIGELSHHQLRGVPVGGGTRVAKDVAGDICNSLKGIDRRHQEEKIRFWYTSGRSQRGRAPKRQRHEAEPRDELTFASHDVVCPSLWE